MPKLLLLMAPTASGKTQLAIELSKRYNGVVVNADSMQVYKELSILTARPSQAEMAGIPHYLFGHLSLLNRYSTGDWYHEVAALLPQLMQNPTLDLIVVAGGTGLYFKVFEEGIHTIPHIPLSVREYWMQQVANEGIESVYRLLIAKDPEAKVLKPNDFQRVVRAMEVLDHTGESFFKLMRNNQPSLVNLPCYKLGIVPEAEVSRARITQRMNQMLDQGLLQEIQDFLTHHGDAMLDKQPHDQAISPWQKIHGLREFARYLEAKQSLTESIQQTLTKTFQYAKRQRTWIRNQFKADSIITKAEQGLELNDLSNFLMSK